MVSGNCGGLMLEHVIPLKDLSPNMADEGKDGNN